VTALIYVDSFLKLRFFERLEVALADSGRFVYATNYLAIYLHARSRGRTCVLMTRQETRHPTEFRKVCAQYLGGTLREPAAEVLASSALTCFLDAVHRFGCDLAIIWNGSRIAERALKEAARLSGIKKVFLEIGNFPGKLFADGEGVNAQSSLARDPSQLDALPEPSDEYYAWKAAFFESRRSGAQKVPQRARLSTLNGARLVDELGWVLLPADGLEAFEARLSRVLSTSRANRRGMPSGRFAFFPLQVSLDSQVLLNYGRSIYEAANDALAIARQWGLPLCVKAHPSEPNPDEKIILMARTEPEMSIVSANTAELIERADRVITINSTVGLEALLLGKPTTLLGKAFYAGLTGKQLDRYVDSFLVNIDFFSSDVINPEESLRILSRAA
jgi:capsular polysaccharide export protein